MMMSIKKAKKDKRDGKSKDRKLQGKHAAFEND